MPADVADGASDFDTSPVRRRSLGGGGAGPPQEGAGLCLSGGGYRAMLFHVGALQRLHECGVLTRVKRVSSVSGGSITAGALALNWDQLVASADADVEGRRRAFDTAVTRPIRHMATRTIDVSSVLSGVAWFGTVADRIAGQYAKHLFGDAKLRSLPAFPSFVFNATNVQTGALWRFTRDYAGDWRVGLVRDPEHLAQIDLARVVGASSAFPPVLSPARFAFEHAMFDGETAPDEESLQEEPFTTDVVLSDGGVYDNLGLESVFKNFTTVLVSDAGGQLEAEEEPGGDWITHAYRILGLVDNQVRSLRKRQLIDAYTSAPSDPHHRAGAYFGIRSDIDNFGLADALPAPTAQTLRLARYPTRLEHVPEVLQERLINWGYAICDAGLRRHGAELLPGAVPPPAWPYPAAGAG